MDSTIENDAPVTCPERQLFTEDGVEPLDCGLPAGHWGPHVDGETSWISYDLTAPADDIEGGGE